MTSSQYINISIYHQYIIHHHYMSHYICLRAKLLSYYTSVGFMEIS